MSEYYNEGAKRRQAAWDKENVQRVVVKLTRNQDGDIIEWLKTKESKQGYIKELIRKDMKER